MFSILVRFLIIETINIYPTLETKGLPSQIPKLKILKILCDASYLVKSPNKKCIYSPIKVVKRVINYWEYYNLPIIKVKK